MGDSTDRERMLRDELARVREERDRYRQMLEQSPGYCFMAEGPEHRLAFINENLRLRLGARGAIERPFREVFPELADGPLHASLDAVFGSGAGHSAAALPLLHDASGLDARFMDVFEAPLVDEGGVAGVMAFVADATERVAAERLAAYLFEEVRAQADELARTTGAPSEAGRLARELAERTGELAREREMARRVVAHAPIGVAHLDRGLTLRWHNPAMAALWDASPAGALGRRLDAFAPALLGAIAPHLEAVFARREETVRVAFRRADGPDGPDAGEAIDWELVLRAVVAPGGEVEGLLVYAQDVSARARGERLQQAQIAALREADALKDVLLEVVSHELRTPLHALMGYGSILRKGLGGALTPDQEAYLSRMLGAAEALGDLIDRILDLGHLKAGGLVLKPALTDLGALLDAALARHAEAIAARGHTLELERDEALPALFADGQRLAQAIEALLDNAVRFTPRGGTIRLRARAADGVLTCEIADDGPGIEPAEVPRLLEPFARWDRTQLRRANGLGLGLPLARAIAEAHGGRLEVETAPGQGSRFALRLPLLEPVVALSGRGARV